MVRKKLSSAAVIHLGSENITMQIIEYTGLSEIRILDEVRRKVKLGEETFKTRKISFSTMLQIVDILKGYRKMMREYGVRDYVLQATTAIREAENQQYFLDQVSVKTGFKIEVVNMSQEIYTKMAALVRTWGVQDQKSLPKEGLLLADISSGGLGLTYLKDRKICFQQNLHVGLVRMREQFTRNERSSAHFDDALTEYIQASLIPVTQELAGTTMEALVLTGTESQVLLDMLQKKCGKRKDPSFTAKEVDVLYKTVQAYTDNQISKVFNFSVEETEIAFSAVILCEQLMAMSKAKKVVLPVDRFIDGMKYLYIARKTDDPFLEAMLVLRMSLVRSIGARFHYDAVHAAWVEQMACRLFDTLASSQGMDRKARILLRAAAYLHNIGKFVSLRSYDVINYYLIRSADILGFSNEECLAIGQISYLYTLDRPELQGSEPLDFDGKFTPLVAKLAAILRLADSMDVSGQQKIQDCKITLKGEELKIKAKSRQRLDLEEWTFEKRCDFFEEAFGIHPVLEKAE